MIDLGRRIFLPRLGHGVAHWKKSDRLVLQLHYGIPGSQLGVAGGDYVLAEVLPRLGFSQGKKKQMSQEFIRSLTNHQQSRYV